MTSAPATLELRLPHVRLSALAWGADDGPLAVLLHGFPDTAWTWRHLAPQLAGYGWRVVAPHTRGYAPSDVAADGCYHVAALMADAVAVHETLGGDERAVVVGHDWGAITAGGLAAHPGSPYSRAVLLAVPPLAALRGAWRDWRRLPRQALMSSYVGFHQLPVLPERLLDRWVPLLWRRWSPGYDAGEDLPRVRAALAAPPHRRAAVGYYRALARPWAVPPAYRRWSAWTGMPRVPTLVLHGTDDGCLRAELAERAARDSPDHVRTEVVPGAGHFLHLERPALVNQLVSDFLGA